MMNSNLKQKIYTINTLQGNIHICALNNINIDNIFILYI